MIAKYKITEFGRAIEVIEVLSETEKTVTLKNGQRDKKQTGWYIIADSAERAKQWLIDAQKFKIEGTESCLAQQKARLIEIEAIK